MTSRWRVLLRGGTLLALLLAVAVASARYWLPERFAVNGPMLQILTGRGVPPPPAEVWQRRLRAPAGFSIGRYAEGLARVRLLRVTPAGDLLASIPRDGRIVLLERDANGDGRADGLRTLIDGLERPHGLDVHGGFLYVAEAGAVARVGFDPAARRLTGPVERIVTGLPVGGNHWTRTLRVGPDAKLYLSIGSSCNACVEDDPRRAAIMRFELDGSAGRVHASGLRNAVSFDWRPGSAELYATDNGRDLLGDDFPPCELDRIVEGGFYGWPFANGNRVPDPDFGAGRAAEIARSIPPVHAFRAHNAPLGIAFLRGLALPPDYRGAALVALHGSWNRSRKDGYEVVSLHFRRDGSLEERRFLWGFEENEDVIGRPVDAAEGPDGAVYVSDDYAGSIYRVAFGEAAGRAAGAALPPAARPDPLAGLAAPERESRAARGAALYARLGCERCHEPGQAQGVVPRPLAGLADRYDVAALAAFFAAPTPPMPAIELTRGQANDLAIFLLATRR
ncbi:MAG: sorbosone dehydrogenase family protein [Vicinamibacteria bacterium]